MPSLAELFARYQFQAPNIAVAGVTHDSRRVQPGYVFVAIRGVPLTSLSPHGLVVSRPALDGHDFIAEALAKGAAAVVGTRELNLPVPYLRVEDSRVALADLSAAFFGHPASKLSLVGVTGSKGKTTTSVLIHHLLNSARAPVGLVSTAGLRIGTKEKFLPGHFTTPEAPELQHALLEFVEAGCKLAVLEVSSHALALERVHGLQFQVGVFTNLEAEHLELHQTMENYLCEKEKLLERSLFSIINRESPYYQRLASRLHWSFGSGGDWQAKLLEENAQGLLFEVSSPVGGFRANLPLTGKFNISNALAAMAASAKMGLGAPALQSALKNFPGVEGRMQIIQALPFRVVVDFAHTEESLRAALAALRPTTKGRLVVVVGAAGERDPGRRTGLGRVAALEADHAIFTEEDHRTESLEAILTAMAETAKRTGGSFEVIPDRREAIRHALASAQAGDTVLLAGKGHERTLERGTAVLPWNEALEAKKVLGELGLS